MANAVKSCRIFRSFAVLQSVFVVLRREIGPSARGGAVGLIPRADVSGQISTVNLISIDCNSTVV